MPNSKVFKLVGLVLIFTSVLSIFFILTSKARTYRVAYVGRYIGLDDADQTLIRSKNFNFLHTHILKKYLKGHCKKEDYELELVIFDNHKSPDSTRAVYERISRDSTIVAVIDNSWGSELLAAQKTINASKIPVIAINGDMNGLNYGSSLFTGNGDNQVNDIVKFIKKGLRVDTVNFVYEVDYSLTEKYFNAFVENQITVLNEFSTKTSKLIDADLEPSKLKEVISNEYVTVINTHTEIGSYFIDFANANINKAKIVGHASIVGSNEKLKPFQNNNEMIILSQSENAVPQTIAKEIIDFKRNFAELNSFNTALFIRRCKDAWSILEKAIDKKDNISKKAIAQNLEKFKSNDLNIGYDILSFDKQGSLIRENIFVQYDKTGEKAYSLQMNSDWQVIPNMSFGIEIIDLQDIDLSTNSFAADFYYWVTTDASFGDIEQFITFENIKPSESEIELVSEKTFGNLAYKLYKVSGVFFENYNEINYPFDNQEISIDIQVLNTAERLRVSFDNESFDQKVSDFSLKGWKQDGFYVTVDNTVTNRLKGNLDLGTKEINKFKNVSFRFNLSRSTLPGILQIILPLLFIGILSVALLYLKNLNFSNIGEPLAAVFLTIIAYSISLSDITPTGSVLTKTDYLFILTLFTVVASFIVGLLHNTPNPIKISVVKIAKYSLTIFYLVSFVLIAIIDFG